MKQKISCLLLLSFNLLLAPAQLSLKVGPDIDYCYQIFPELTYYIGENIEIQNASGPVSITWDCQYKVGNSLFTASDFLSDTTTLNPFFIETPLGDDRVQFKITVMDSVGNKAKDSIGVRFSQFSYSTVEYQYSITSGDSIELGHKSIDGGIGALEYRWRPTDGLLDSTAWVTWAKPKTSTVYYQVAWDEIGCESLPNKVYTIEVKPASVSKSNAASVLKQVGNKIVFDTPQSIEKTISVYSMDGSLIFKTKTTSNNIDLSSNLHDSKLYLCIVSIDSEYYSLKFKKR